MMTTARCLGLVMLLFVAGCSNEASETEPAGSRDADSLPPAERTAVSATLVALPEDGELSFREALQQRLEQSTGSVAGVDNWLFHPRALEYLLVDDVSAQPPEANPLPVVVGYAEALRARGVELIFCPVPVKAAVYPEKLGFSAPVPEDLGPAYQRFLQELDDRGVSCIDLRDVLRAAKDTEAALLYQAQDTHWTAAGIDATALHLAARVKESDWWDDLQPDVIDYTRQPATFKRRGDLVPNLPARMQLSYRPVSLVGKQVLTPEGERFRSSRSSPILVLGDSYASVYELEDCGSAGIAAQLSRQLQRPVDLIAGQGMGPNVWQKLCARGKGALDGKRVVIWIMSARDLWQAPVPWRQETLPAAAKADATTAREAPSNPRTVTATVVEATQPRRDRDYDHALGVHLYRVDSQGDGAGAMKRFLGYRMMIRNREVVPAACAEEGQRYRLEIIPYEVIAQKHPEYAAYEVLNTTSVLFDVPRMWVLDATLLDETQ
jgi:hypothetical protein